MTPARVAGFTDHWDIDDVDSPPRCESGAEVAVLVVAKRDADPLKVRPG